MITRGELRGGVLVILNDLVNIDQSNPTGQRYNTTALNYLINDSIQYYARLINTKYQGYLSDEMTVNALADVSEYDLGEDFRSPIYEVRRTINQMDYALDPRAPYMISLPTQSVPNSSWVPCYWLEGITLHLTSPPQSNETNALRVKFQRKVTNLDADSDELDPQLFDAINCIELRAAVRALKAKDVSGALKTIGGWETELQQEEIMLLQQVGNRYVKPIKPIPVTYIDSFY